MKKISETMYNRLLAQGEEAKELDNKELASHIFKAIGATYRDDEEKFEYSIDELETNVKQSLWNSAIEIANYYDLKKVGVEELDEVINLLSENVLNTLKAKMKVSSVFGPNEPKVPGQI